MCVDEEFLPVLADLIRELLGGRKHFTRIGLEKHHRRARVETRTGFHRNFHHFAIGRKVKDLLAVASPFGLHAASVRDLTLSMRLGKRGYVNLPASTLIGGVCDPLAIGGEPAAL